MIGRTLVLGTAAGLVFGAASRGSPPRIIAVDETTLPRSFQARSPRHIAFDTLIVAQLQAAGFAIIPPESTAAVWRHVRDSVGGFYDRYSGRVVDDKLQAVMGRTLAQLREHYHIAAWLRPFVSRVSVPFSGGKIAWDGIEERSGGRGGLGGFLLGEHTGTLPGLSLRISLVDSTARTIYRGAGGLELAGRIQDGRLVDLTPDSLLGDDARIARAVHLALDSLPTSFRP